MEIEEAAIASLVLDPENEREHPADNLKDIKNSLKLFGQQSPITVQRETRVILKGNGKTAVLSTACGHAEDQAV